MNKQLSSPDEPVFSEIALLIQERRQRAIRAVNTELIDLYWEVGKILHRKVEQENWGKKVIDELAGYLKRAEPGLRGFTRPNLYRMKQFYETYWEESIVSALLRQLPWTQNIIILSQAKSAEEREFYLTMAAREKWSSRELERRLKGALFERAMLSPAIVSPVVRQLHPLAESVFKDSYKFQKILLIIFS